MSVQHGSGMRRCGTSLLQGRTSWNGTSRTGGAPVVVTLGELEQAFRLEQFRDYLAFEAGTSPHTVSNYVRDIRRLLDNAAGKGERHPEDVTSVQLREFVYALKDLGLAPATIRRQIS